ncbi:hypothetical protein B0H13DRAFT_2001217 [Mycena leptocephala]|nr:hypothetical protein B0H13DRAFT_2001217 [Mycena leptocephala]
MQLLAAITTSLMLVSSTTAASLTLFTGTGFTGQSATLTNNGECGAINEPFISHLLSAKASAGDICFLYKDANGCSDCGACVDANGFRDMTAVPAVHHFRCVTADSQGCSNAACDFH